MLDTLLGDVLHSAIDDLGPGGFVAGIGVVVEAIEQARDRVRYAPLPRASGLLR